MRLNWFWIVIGVIIGSWLNRALRPLTSIPEVVTITIGVAILTLGIGIHFLNARRKKLREKKS